jgi:hypothetical protein
MTSEENDQHFFDTIGVIHFEFIPQSQTKTKHIMWKYGRGYVKMCAETI